MLFSIAVHEREDCVNDMIENILWHVPDSKILIHVAHGFFFHLQSKYKNKVFINNESYCTGFIDGTLTYVHLSNYKYAIKQNIKFGMFVPFGSNQLFIKKGFDKYAENYDCVGFPDSYNQSIKETDKTHYPKFKKDFIFKDIFEGHDIYKSAPEGTYYKKELVDVLVYKLSNNNRFKFCDKYIYKSVVGKQFRLIIRTLVRIKDKIKLKKYTPSIFSPFSYANEEIIFPSLTSIKTLKKGDMICYTPWNRDNLEVTIDEVDKIIKSGSNIYTVKRVPRDINNNVRKYIRVLSNNYQ